MAPTLYTSASAKRLWIGRDLVDATRPGTAVAGAVSFPRMDATLHQRRVEAVASTMDDIRRIEASGPLDREIVAAIRTRLLELAAHRELFPAADFPPPDGTDSKQGACLYRIAQDDDDRFALYINSCRDSTDSPPHNHTTWAVVVGFDGQELNRFYRRTESGGVEQTHEEVVEAGTGVAMLPVDLHSIHIRGGGLNFHCYGRALERLDSREYYRAADNSWAIFPARVDIREARTAPVG